MAFKLASRTREITATTGTGAALTLGGLVPGSSNNQLFEDGLGVGNSTTYMALSGDGIGFEEGIGSLTDATHFNRDIVLRNHLGTTARIDLSGTSRVFSAYSGEFLRLLMELCGVTAPANGQVFVIGGSLVPTFTNEPTSEGQVFTFNGTDVDWRMGAARVWQETCDLITASNLAATYANGTAGVGATLTMTANGVFSHNGMSANAGGGLGVSSLIMVAFQTDNKQNGLYRLTTVGTAGTQAVLTRAATYDGSDPDFVSYGLIFGVNGGAVNSKTVWMIDTTNVSPDPFVFGTHGIFFTKIGGTITGTLEDIGTAPNSILFQNGSGWAAVKEPMTFGFSAPQTTAYSNGQVIGHYNPPCAITIPANFGTHIGLSSKASGAANATASTVFSLQKCLAANDPTNEANWSQIGTITFATGTVTPTFATSSGAAQSIADGDFLRVKGPTTADATFAGFRLTVIAYRT